MRRIFRAWTGAFLVLLALAGVPADPALAQYTLIPMEGNVQRNHLRAYGVVYWALEHPRNFAAEWLLNYRDGAFVIKEAEQTASRCRLKGVTYQLIDADRLETIHGEMEQGNMEVVVLEKAPSVAVYAPPETDPWDDAVRLALEYAEIEHTIIYDKEIMAGRHYDYDWIHLHHEDFTGQYGKFYRSYHMQPWYQEKVQNARILARELGFQTVQEEKRAVVTALKDYIAKGGFLFAMCSATDTYDIALAAAGMDIIPPEIDGTPIEPGVQSKLDYGQALAFESFHLITDAMEYEHSDIDIPLPPNLGLDWNGEYFTLFDFSARIDPIPSMLVQCHTAQVREFRGQCTAFKKDKVKRKVIILAEMQGGEAVKYLHGNFGEGTFTFLAGHDPEDYAHQVGEDPTDLALYPNSPGYRLILNNILFPAAKKKKLKT